MQYTDLYMQYHAKYAVEKMAKDLPLTDADRWDWLISLRQESFRLFQGTTSGVVLTCSALKRKYRDVIRLIALEDSNIVVHFIYLRVDAEVLLQRVRMRQNHYMKESMVKSQLDILEEPHDKETDVLSVNVDGNITTVHAAVIAVVNRIIERE
jgi:gluconokinase